MAYSGLNNSTDAAAELGRNRLSMEMGRVTRDGTAAPVSRDQILSEAKRTGKYSCSLFG